MARNAEKAMSMLSRWVDMKKNEKKFRPARPSSPSQCNDIEVLEKFRRDMIHEITKKVSQIQNAFWEFCDGLNIAGLGEFRLRDLNDEINRLIRQKRKYEERIKQLGGPDYTKIGQDLDDNGTEIIGSGGYKYFGATKDLPGVKELFENQHIRADQSDKKSKYQLTRCIDIDYYGYRTTNDLYIDVEAESELEETLRKKALENWENCVDDELFKELYTKKSKYKQFSDLVEFDPDNPTSTTIHQVSQQQQQHETNSPPITPTNTISNIPTQEEVENALVERKKAELLARYTSDELIQQEKESKTLVKHQ